MSTLVGEGSHMIAELNRLIELVELDMSSDLDVATLANSAGSTQYHVRRMFSTLAGMPLSEYVRRRRMTMAAADLIRGDGVLDTAVRYGYGSSEAFGRAFRAVHGVSAVDIRQNGGPLRTQAKLRFRLTVEGSTTMDARIIDHPAIRLIGHAARVPLVHRGVNEHIQAHINALPLDEHARLKALSNVEPAGLLQVSDGVDPDYAEGSELTYLHGVAVSIDTDTPADLGTIEVPAGYWVALRASGAYPEVLQEAYALSAAEWFPSNPWRLRPGPSIVATLDRSADFSIATVELWLPIERD